MIDKLRAEVEKFVGEPISGAMISVAQIRALYGEDLVDALEYRKLSYIDFPWIQYSGPLAIHSAGTAWIGNSRDLCANYTIPDLCDKQSSQKPRLFPLVISYTYDSLIVSIAITSINYVYSFVHEYPLEVYLGLGYDARHNNPNEDLYWEKVQDALMFPISTNPIDVHISKVLVYGDASQKAKFRQVLKVVTDHLAVTMGVVPEVVDGDPVFSAANGIAELAKRMIYSDEGTSLSSGLREDL